MYNPFFFLKGVNLTHNFNEANIHPVETVFSHKNLSLQIETSSPHIIAPRPWMQTVIPHTITPDTLMPTITSSIYLLLISY